MFEASGDMEALTPEEVFAAFETLGEWVGHVAAPETAIVEVRNGAVEVTRCPPSANVVVLNFDGNEVGEGQT